MMKWSLGLFLLIISDFTSAYSQDTMPKGHPVAEIFTNFHLNINDQEETTGFEITRAHLGYVFTPEGHFSGAVVVNPGNPDDLPEGSEPRRYAYFREASISYTNDNLKLSFGITGTRLFSFQQRFWGKRYIAKPYQSINNYGYVADLGVAADFKINETLEIDATLMNGEGYCNIQSDNSLKTGLGLNITPHTNLSFRIYGEIIRSYGLWQPMILGFAGYKNEKVSIGGEFTYKSNVDLLMGHHSWGFSTTGAVTIIKDTELFTRFDFSTSLTPDNEIRPWNYLMDGEFLIVGLQRSFNDFVNIALDYQGKFPFDSASPRSEMIYLNAVLKFGSF